MTDFPRPIFAIVDVGSKSIRLLVARRLSNEAFEVVDEERYDSRLGQGQAGGALAPDAIDRGLQAMRVISQVAASYSPARIVAVGTEALRRAPNAQEFVERVFAETGITVRILPGDEEAFASFLGVINSNDVRDGMHLDIGGGSLEVMQFQSRELRDAVSVPFGAIYATERFFASDPPTNKEVRALRKALKSELRLDARWPVIHGAGGAVRNLARMVRSRRSYPLRRLHGFVVERRELRRLTRDLLAVPADERRKLSGLGAERVETLPAAAVVVGEVMDLVGAKQLVVSGQGLREGLLWQELRGESAILPDVRRASIAGLASANGVDLIHAEPEVAVAARLFDVTEPIHGLGDFERDLLVSAARLAEIGTHIDYYSRDRHAEYLVHSGDLHGFSHREICLLAATVRWSMSGSPDLSPYARIVEAGDQARVATLAAMLGVARATWRRTPSPVNGFDVSLKKDRLTLHLEARSPVDAEHHALERQLRRLESVLPVRCSIA